MHVAIRLWPEQNNFKYENTPEMVVYLRTHDTELYDYCLQMLILKHLNGDDFEL